MSDIFSAAATVETIKREMQASSPVLESKFQEAIKITNKKIFVFDCVPWAGYTKTKEKFSISTGTQSKVSAYVRNMHGKEISKWFACAPYFPQRDVQIYSSIIYFKEALLREIAKEKEECVFILISDFAVEEEITALKQGLEKIFHKEVSIIVSIIKNVVTENDIPRE